ncbi:hypothetical protein LSH36_8g01061 [Paralvinella palmiformis]|uniref:Uncharacterized protein n=1 Tax=Paralvinella palmiformis TaxID=53620 RepID=A0AAD9KDB5_9ANNE|nr:hypothetical protein LSH36_8g01061 [Paralvinella palmiformis]
MKRSVHALYRHSEDYMDESPMSTILPKKKSKSLVLGHEDGIVRVYSLPQCGDISHVECLECIQTLESKGGPIQTLMIHDVTKLAHNDIIVADSRGMVTIFSNEQILTRKAVSEHCIQCIGIQKDALGYNAIIIGDRQGHVAAFSPFTEFWRVRLSDLGQYKNLALRPQVTCVHITELTDKYGQRRSCVLVSDTCKAVHMIQGGSIVLTLYTPAVVTAMVSGHFVESNEADENDTVMANQTWTEEQVLMGTDNGAIYIMANFQIYQEEYANIHHTITHLSTLASADSQITDTLLCAGHFDALCILRDGQEISHHKTSAWIISLVTADINNDGVDEILIGCHDNTLHALKVTFGCSKK